MSADLSARSGENAGADERDPLLARVTIVTRYFPYPQRTGALLYSAQLIALWSRLARDVDVFCAPQAGSHVESKAALNVSFCLADTQTTNPLRYLLSREPKSACDFATETNRQRLRRFLQERRPNLIVIDHVGATWSASVIETYRSSLAPRPLLIYSTHNREAFTRLSIAAEAGIAGGLAHLFDAGRLMLREYRMTKAADIVTCITPSDSAAYGRAGASAPIVLAPQHTGPVVQKRHIDRAVPKKIVLAGSFVWSAKILNLTHFLQVASPVFRRTGIELHVVGRMHEKDRAEFKRRHAWAIFHGEVEEIEPFLSDARIGLLIDRAGGGFKYTLLTYAFNRVPVAALEDAIEDKSLFGSCIRTRTRAELAAKAVAAIDDVDELNRLQEALFNSLRHFLSDEANFKTVRRALRLTAEVA